jgi:hypothetical protein
MRHGALRIPRRCIPPEELRAASGRARATGREQSFAHSARAELHALRASINGVSQWGQSTRINIFSIFLIDFSILLTALPSETDRLTQWGQSTRINIFSIFLIDFSILLSALPSETDRLTEPGCPIASFWAIHSLLTEVWVRNMMAS